MRIHDSGEAKLQRRMPAAAPAPEGAGLVEQIKARIQEVHDPEIPVNLYDLGLIYEIRPSAASRSCVIRMTLTSANCPEAQSLPVQVQQAAESVDGIDHAHVVLVWEPAWDKSMMSDEAQLHLGLL
ncbi:iron-sulfur cluster assembly protein [Phycisphaera mikurensis]|uniref:MIP18 family-like domain-containing protein n=1 Tax=Phycisphaera mikurensis (strain NBRC 102666 / KCTC 22515 / FYK2301M01) TaxID=1142394 RepID=I0IJ04_PHYMF|nr:iron-sulfur cluster assembly protein [Phycisphaera mikurensis]MBB6443089.1 metal-sulfur cluster biosynthetic enzyme [Phycisphaera mikurensis]BAM05242.1 hypothetical protein PSMK_30830 [Phycisphaera mikurensis NBRC 102666]